MINSMTGSISLRRLYQMTAGFALAGCLWQWAAAGPKSALAFLLGALGSAANLWVFEWLTRVIAPRESPLPDAGGETGTERKSPWGAGLFIGRYAALWLVGYTTVKALDVSPLPVLLGLLVSTAAVLAASIVELIRSLFGK